MNNFSLLDKQEAKMKDIFFFFFLDLCPFLFIYFLFCLYFLAFLLFFSCSCSCSYFSSFSLSSFLKMNFCFVLITFFQLFFLFADSKTKKSTSSSSLAQDFSPSTILQKVLSDYGKGEELLFQWHKGNRGNNNVFSAIEYFQQADSLLTTLIQSSESLSFTNSDLSSQNINENLNVLDYLNSIKTQIYLHINLSFRLTSKGEEAAKALLPLYPLLRDSMDSDASSSAYSSVQGCRDLAHVLCNHAESLMIAGNSHLHLSILLLRYSLTLSPCRVDKYYLLTQLLTETKYFKTLSQKNFKKEENSSIIEELERNYWLNFSESLNFLQEECSEKNFFEPSSRIHHEFVSFNPWFPLSMTEFNQISSVTQCPDCLKHCMDVDHLNELSLSSTLSTSTSSVESYKLVSQSNFQSLRFSDLVYARSISYSNGKFFDKSWNTIIQANTMELLSRKKKNFDNVFKFQEAIVQFEQAKSIFNEDFFKIFPNIREESSKAPIFIVGMMR